MCRARLPRRPSQDGEAGRARREAGVQARRGRRKGARQDAGAARQGEEARRRSRTFRRSWFNGPRRPPRLPRRAPRRPPTPRRKLPRSPASTAASRRAGTTALPDVHNSADGVVKSDNIQWISNARGTNGNFSGANFIHFENLGYDFLFGDGTGGLSIFSLKDPEQPAVRRRAHGSTRPPAAGRLGTDPADTAARF